MTGLAIFLGGLIIGTLFGAFVLALVIVGTAKDRV